MIGTLEVKCCAAQPQKPLTPCFSFLDSPQSFRIIEVPKAIGTWEITGVQVSVQYPDNTNLLKDATRVSGNVYVATFNGSAVAGKVTQGYKILANGVDEQGNEIEGYVLGVGDVYVLECEQDIRSLVEKHSLRLCDDLPSEPAEGDAMILGEELKIYDGEKWITISGGNDDVYTKEEIDEKVAEIDSSLGELSSSISALGDDVSSKRDYIDLTLDCTGCLEDRPNDYDHSPLHEDLPHCGIDAFNLEWTYPDEQRGLASMFVYYPEGEYNHRQKEWHTFDNLMPFEVWYIQPELTAEDQRWKFHLKSGSYPTWETILEFTPDEIAQAGDEGLPVTISVDGSEYEARLKVKYANSPIATVMTVDEKIEDRIGLALRGINY